MTDLAHLLKAAFPAITAITAEIALVPPTPLPLRYSSSIMMDLPNLESAIYGGQDAGGYRFLARSPGFREEWLVPAERLCTGFGERPAGVVCPRAIFARPLGRNHVVVVQVADQVCDDQGRPGTLAFYLIVLPAALYAGLGGDPFHLADQFPAPWTARVTLSPLDCPQPSPRRRVEDAQALLNVPNSATLLGSAQALLDGGRVVFERAAPDESLLRSLWSLLPTSSRADCWPASFAFGNALEFHAVAVPRIVLKQFVNHIHEGQAGDYPEGKYEFDLQTAIENGDQETLDALFARRSYREVRRIGLLLLGVVLLLPLIAFLLKNDPPPRERKSDPPGNRKPESFHLGAPEEFEPLTEDQTRELSHKLLSLMDRLKVPWPVQPREVLLLLGVASPSPGTGSLRVAATLALDRRDRAILEELIPVLDRALGTPNPQRNPGPMERLGPAKRQLRVLLWKEGVLRYDDRRLTPAELIEHLQEAVLKRRTEAK